MKHKRAAVTAELLTAFFKGDCLLNEPVETMPKDLHLVNVYWELQLERSVLWCLFESADFEDVPEGATVPKWEPQWKVKTREEISL